MVATRKKVVVIDDNEILLRAWERILTREECTPFTTTQPEEALDMINREAIDLVICDIVMPQMDGFDVIERLNGMGHHPKVVLTTGYVCDFSKLKVDGIAKELHVLMKPYNDIAEIVRFIHRVLDDDDTLEEEDSFNSLDDTKVHLWSL
jgi:DNA-binding NtrC family response regulator